MIPAWNSLAVLPPIWPGQAGSSPNRSPYLASLSELVRRFAISSERIEILRGFLRYRAALHQAGVTVGFQWLNGSFVEDKETLLRTPPSDVDVVTFFIFRTESMNSNSVRRTAYFSIPNTRKQNFTWMPTGWSSENR